MSIYPEYSSGVVEVPGARIAYEIGGDGPAVVLVHAGIADMGMWDEQVAALRPRYRVLRYDCRGFGRTVTEDVPFTNRADLIALLDHHGIARAALVGCSRGAAIALDTAIDHPDRVAALVWVCGGVNGHQPPDAIFDPAEIALFESMEAAEAAADWERVADLDVRLWVDGPLQPAGRAAPEVRERVRAMALNNYLTVTAFGQPQPMDPPAAQRLHELRAPALAIVGDLDPASTADAAAFLTHAVPGIRVAHFPDAAHMPNMEQPERFNALLLEFLKEYR